MDNNEFIQAARQSSKLIREAFRQLIKKAEQIWNELEELFNESNIEFAEPLHPALRTKTFQRFKLKHQVMLNKPKQIFARTNC